MLIGAGGPPPPPYTPEPNPIEAQWRPFRKATGNRPYEDAGQTQESIRAIPGAETPIVRTSDYPAR